MRVVRKGCDSGRQRLRLGLIGPGAVLGLAVASCTSMPRAPASSCMQQTVDSLQQEGLSDSRLHCLASGTIALRCGHFSAWMAGYGKEFADLFGPGDFEWKDFRANAAGRACAGRSAEEQNLNPCCADAGY